MSYLLFDMKNDESFVWNAHRIRAGVGGSMMHLNIAQYFFCFPFLSLSLIFSESLSLSFISPHIYGLQFTIFSI